MGRNINYHNKVISLLVIGETASLRIAKWITETIIIHFSSFIYFQFMKFPAYGLNPQCSSSQYKENGFIFGESDSSTTQVR